MIIIRDVIRSVIRNVVTDVIGDADTGLDLGQESGTLLDAADISDPTLAALSSAFNQTLAHPELYGQSIAIGSSPADANAGLMKTFDTPLSVTADDVITLWFWQDWPAGDAANSGDYPLFSGKTQVQVFVYSPDNNITTYVCPMPWGRMRGWTPVQIDLSAASSPTTRGIMNTPVVGGANDEFLTEGIHRIYIQCRELGANYRELSTPLVYGGMVLNQQHNPFFMPYFDDGYRYIIDPESGESITENTLEHMSSLGQVGTLGIIADRILSSSFHYMTPANIHELYEAGWDIGLHSGYYWGSRTTGAEGSTTHFNLTSVGTTATLSTNYSWMRSPLVDGAQVIVSGSDVAQYNGTFTVTYVDDQTVTFTIPDAGDVSPTTFSFDGSWGSIDFDTQDNREAAKQAIKADMNYNLEFLKNPYEKLTEAGFTGIEYLIGVDWTDGDTSSVLPGNSWKSSGYEWSGMIQSSLDELGINSARTSQPLMEMSKTYPVGTGNDHYPTDFFVAGAVIENTYWLPDSASPYNGGVLSTALSAVNTVIPATARQGGTFSPMIHQITDNPATVGNTSYNRNDWKGVCEAADTEGLTPITATKYAQLQRDAGDASVSFKGTEHLSSPLDGEVFAIDNFRRRLQRMGYWGSLKGLWITGLRGDNGKTNLITGDTLVLNETGTGAVAPTWGDNGVTFTESLVFGAHYYLETGVTMPDVSNYSFGGYTFDWVAPTNSGINGLMAARVGNEDNYGIEFWDNGQGQKTWHGDGSCDFDVSSIPDGTLLSARRRNGVNSDTQCGFGNITETSSITATPNTETFRLGHSGHALDYGWSGTVSLFYIGEGMAHSQIEMESAIKILLYELNNRDVWDDSLLWDDSSYWL